MRIAFLGAVEFSRHCLAEVIRQGGEVVAVFTLDPAKQSRHSDYADLAPLARSHGIPVHLVTNINDPAALAAMREARPDIIFVFGWSQLIGPELRSIAPCLGTHPAMLPRNRGRHPIVWTLVYGLTEGGLTFFYLDDGADSGDIVWQRPFPVSIDDDAGTLLKKIEVLASDAISEFLPQLAAGTAPRVVQDHSLANYWRKRGEADGEIHWDRPAAEIHNLIRALTRPYPGAHTFLDGERVIVWKARPSAELVKAAPGAIQAQTADGWIVATGDGTVEILSWQSERPLHTDALFSTTSTLHP